jgi:hypothetical protein
LLNKVIKNQPTISILYCCLLLKEWISFRGFQFSNEELVMLSKAHHEIWQRRGILSEQYHLMKSRLLLEQILIKTGLTSQIDVSLLYFKVLTYLSEYFKASQIIESIIDCNPKHEFIANFCFYAGAVFKSLKQCDKSSEYFLASVANNALTPSFFSKRDVYIVIYANLCQKLNDDYMSENSQYYNDFKSDANYILVQIIFC